jgi:hypothetical protein
MRFSLTLRQGQGLALAQNREAHPHFREHLAGRMGFMESIHIEKGRRLRAIFDQITWE